MIGVGVQFSAATRVVTKERYIAACQLLLLAAFVATLIIAVTGVARLDIVGPRVSSPTDQSVHTHVPASGRR